MTKQHALAFLFNAPTARLWLPAFAAVAIGDPVAGRALAPFLGPETEQIEGGGRARVPGEEHFARTWAVIKPGFLDQRTDGYVRTVRHLRSEHIRTQIPPHLIALPNQWIKVFLGNVATDLGQLSEMAPHILSGAESFTHDIGGDLRVVRMPFASARAEMLKYFSDVQVPREPGEGFWRALVHGPVGRDMGSRTVNVGTVERVLNRHLHPNLVRQFMRYAPRG